MTPSASGPIPSRSLPSSEARGSGRPELTGVILAGGPASRFDGLPKGLQMVGGRRLIDRVAAVLRPATDRLLVVSNDPNADEWLPDASVSTDVLPGRASLIGIHTALARSSGDVIVVAWDMPFVPAALIDEIAARLRRGAVAVIPFGPNGAEAVCAGYSRAVLPHVERLATLGALKLSAFVSELPGVDRLGEGELARIGDPSVMFFNVNSAADRDRAEVIARAL